MKDSGVEWLGKVPEHWGVVPNRSIFDEILERDSEDEEMLSVTIKQGVMKQTILLETTSKKDSSNLDRSKYKLVHPGDIVYNKMRAWQGAIGSSKYLGIVSPAYIVQRPLNSCLSDFFHLLFRTPSFAKEAERRSYGIASDMWSLRPEHFKMIYSCLPSLSEQEDIVLYLDHMGAKINELVKAQDNLISLLIEQKQAILWRIITKGINPHVPLKDSGVEWLGEVPEHWGIQRVKNLFRLRTEKSGTNHGKELLSIYTHIGVKPRKDLEQKGNRATTTDDYWIVRKGDLICNKLLAWMGAIGVSDYDGVTSPAYDILMPKGNVFPQYYHHLFRTKNCQQKFKQRSRGIMDVRLRLYFDQLGQIFIPVPPENEQIAIIQHYKEVTDEINIVIESAKKEIRLLKEYQNCLVTNAVTGKIDVRETVAKLRVNKPNNI